MTPMTLFRHIWMTNGCQIQNQRTKLPLGTQKSEKWLMTSSKVIDLWWPRLTSEWSQCQCKPWVSPRNTYPCPYHQQKYRSSQVSGVETVRNVHPSADCVVGWTTLSASRPGPLGRRWQRGLWPLLACQEGPGSDHTVCRRVYISPDMTLEITSQVKSHGRYGLDIFRKDVK